MKAQKSFRFYFSSFKASENIKNPRRFVLFWCFIPISSVFVRSGLSGSSTGRVPVLIFTPEQDFTIIFSEVSNYRGTERLVFWLCVFVFVLGSKMSNLLQASFSSKFELDSERKKKKHFICSQTVDLLFWSKLGRFCSPTT